MRRTRTWRTGTARRKRTRRAAAELSRIPRKVARSTRHKEPPETAVMVAARGELYMRASSPADGVHAD
eukprot:2656280-Pyramimonas_sp.AAC.2